MYKKAPAKVLLRDFFTISTQAFGRQGTVDQRRAVRRFLNDDEKVAATITHLMEEPYERNQFLVVAEYRLAPCMVLNSQTYSGTSMADLEFSISRGALGMGSTCTWYGSPDGRADWSPLQYIPRDLVESDSESESSSRGQHRS